MKEMIRIIPMAAYLAVGAVSLIMACKSIFGKRPLPFQEKAAGISWGKTDRSLQHVMIALMRVSGLGFLVTAALLIVSPIVNYFAPHAFTQYVIPFISLMYCGGLFLVNYSLFRKTKSPTPWKGSLCVILIILAGIAVSSIGSWK